MPVDKNLYFLQPTSDQAISVAKILNDHSLILITAVLLAHEKEPQYLKRIYNNIIKVDSYEELNKNNILVPFGASSTESLLKQSQIRLNKVAMSQNVLAVYDKPNFLKFCTEHDLPVPKTYLEESLIPDTAYPIFYKQKHEKGGGIRGIANSSKELPQSFQEDLIYQELIDTQGTYGVGFIANEGNLLTSYCHFEEISYPSSGGSAVVVKPVKNPRLIELTKQFLKQSNYSGWGLAEFKWCSRRQDFVFMEVNAKFWASCELALRNNANFNKYLFGVDSKEDDIEGIVFLNRALSLSLIRALNIIRKNKNLSYSYVS
ncbi:hypothetical protein [Psychrobacter lutiphocae]|uniref:hypothetical protein n=1 Tax=Psychrobacter lutiphocae TaxID=540500 RepID=UPI0019183F37|nr:hypothetical protein [Psychrobacter lutiphocae]